MARLSETYRAERRNRARRQRLLWRALPRRTTHKLSVTQFVDVPRDSAHEVLNDEAAASQPTTSGESNDS